MHVCDPFETTARIARLIEEVQAEKEKIADEEVDGWLIRRPSIFDVNDHFGMFFAYSRDGAAPLSLPKTDFELTLGVMDGEIRLAGYAGTLRAHQFFVIRPKDGRTVTAIEPNTVLCAFFFRGSGDDAEQQLAAR